MGEVLVSEKAQGDNREAAVFICPRECHSFGWDRSHLKWVSLKYKYLLEQITSLGS